MEQDGSLPSPEDLGGHRKWSLCGDFKVCTACFCGILGISRNKLGRFKKWVVAGHLGPVSIAKSDKPSVQLRDHPQYRHADSWLSHCYAHVAEHRADSLIPGSEQVEDPTKEVLPELADPALDLPLPAEEDTSRLPKKFLPPGSLNELFEFCSFAVPSLVKPKHECCSLGPWETSLPKQ
jgi:hypothetical protein